MPKIHRTAVFTIHQPTKHLRAVFDQALRMYTHAFYGLLHRFAAYTPEELRAMATYAVDAEGQPQLSDKRLVRHIFPLAQQYQIEGGMRESVCFDVAAAILSYLALLASPKQDSLPSYPGSLRPADVETVRWQALEKLAALADNRAVENMLLAATARVDHKTLVPILFSRVDADRQCGILYNAETRRYYCRLFLLPPNARLARPLTIAGRYQDIRTGKMYACEQEAKGNPNVTSFGKGARSVLAPLELGRWHERPLRFTNNAAFLSLRDEQGHATPARPVRARLAKDGDDYRLLVTFEFPRPTKVQPQALLGINRGMTVLAAGAIMSLDGRQIGDTFVASGKELQRLQRDRERNTRLLQQRGKLSRGDKRQGRIGDQHAQITANQIVALAQQYQAMVVMENLASFSTPRKPGRKQRLKPAGPQVFLRPYLSRRQYQKVLRLVDMKLAMVGLPKVRLVHPSFISQTCIACGSINKESRPAPDRSRFRCPACHYESQVDIVAGVNVARKTLWLTERLEEKKRGVEVKDRTPWSSWIRAYCTGNKLRV